MKNMRIDDHMPEFRLKAFALMGLALNDGARRVLIESRNNAPFDKGALRSQSDITQPSKFSRKINYYVEYAPAQEAGRAGSRTFKNYTTAGTGAHFLENAGVKVSKTMMRTFLKYGRRV